MIRGDREIAGYIDEKYFSPPFFVLQQEIVTDQCPNPYLICTLNHANQNIPPTIISVGFTAGAKINEEIFRQEHDGIATDVDENTLNSLINGRQTENKIVQMANGTLGVELNRDHPKNPMPFDDYLNLLDKSVYPNHEILAQMAAMPTSHPTEIPTQTFKPLPTQSTEGREVAPPPQAKSTGVNLTQTAEIGIAALDLAILGTMSYFVVRQLAYLLSAPARKERKRQHDLYIASRPPHSGRVVREKHFYERFRW
jgi:hypothetical protein